MLPGVGIFGTSGLSKSIALILKSCGFDLVAVWSRTSKEAAEFASDMGIPFSTNKVDGLLLRSDVGFVVICCAPYLQSPIAVKTLGIGKHVVVIPPSGPSQLEVLKMVKAASYYPTLMSMICHGLRFLPVFIKMKQHIVSGYIGDIYLFEVRVHSSSPAHDFGWECDVMMGGGALSTHGSYVIDIISFLSGKRAKSVHGMVKTYVKQTPKINGIREITSDDFSSFQLQMEDDISASCAINNHCQGEFLHEITVIGSKGRLVARDMDLYAKLNDGKNINESVLHYESHHEDELKLMDVSEDSGRVPFNKGLQKALQNIAEAFQDQEDIHDWNPKLIPSRATFDDALYVQTVIDAIRKSSQLKRWVKVDILEEEPDPNPHLSSVVRRSALTAFY